MANLKQKIAYFQYSTSDSTKMNELKIECLDSGNSFLEAKGLWVSLLQEIYGNEGHFTTMQEKKYKVFAYNLGTTSEKIKSMIKMMIDIGLFNKEKFEKEGVLTSKNIQINCIDIRKKLRRGLLEKFEHACFEWVEYQNAVYNGKGGAKAFKEKEKNLKKEEINQEIQKKKEKVIKEKAKKVEKSLEKLEKEVLDEDNFWED